MEDVSMFNISANSRKHKPKKVQLYTSLSDKTYMFIVNFILWAALVLVAIPLIFVLASSFSSAEAIASGRVFLWPVEFNIRGYKMIFKTSAIMIGYRNSVFYTVVGTFINIIMTLLIAYPLSRKDFQARSHITVLLAITMFFNGGLIPTYLLIRNLNMLDTIWAMLIPTALGVWNVIITRTYIQSNIPMDLYESASLEGCGDFYYFYKIVIPLSQPIIAVMALFYAVGHWNSYFNAMLYLSSRELFPLQLILRDILILNMGLGNPHDVDRQQELLYFSYLLRYSTIVVASVDAIVAAQPYRHHINIIPEILKAGKPLLTEKPLALSVEAGEQLVQLADKMGVLYMVGNHKRSDPAIEYAKKLIDEWKETKEYGNLRYIRITMPPGDWIGGAGAALNSDEAYPEIQLESDATYFNKEMAQAYDSFVNYYIHQVNLLRFLLGEPYKVAFADKSGVLLVAESKSGICGIIEMAPYENTIDWQENALICFEKGYIKVDLPAPLACQQPGHITIMKDNGRDEPVVIQPSLPKIHAMQNQAMNFLAAIRGEKPAPCEAREALEDLKIARDYIKLYFS